MASGAFGEPIRTLLWLETVVVYICRCTVHFGKELGELGTSFFCPVSQEFEFDS